MAPMGSLSAWKRGRLAEELWLRADRKEAREKLEELFRAASDDARLASLVAHVRSEAGETDEALEAAAAARPGLSATAAAVLESSVLLDAGRRDEARRVLEAARPADPEGVAVPGLIGVLDLEDAGFRGARAKVESLPPGALWCTPVLSRLVLALETAIEARAARGDVPPGLHRARSVLVRPQVEGAARRFWIEKAAGALSALAGPSASAARGLRRDLERALRTSDHAAAARSLEELGNALGSRRSREADRRSLLALELAFLLERFGEIERLRAEWMRSGGEEDDPYPAALAAHAQVALRKPDRALELLAPFREMAAAEPALLHLEAIARLARGEAAAASGLLRRAAGLDDISLVRVAREEAAVLDGEPAAAGAAR